MAVFLTVLVGVFAALAIYGRTWTTKKEKEESLRRDAALPFTKRVLNFSPDIPRWANVLLLVVTIIAGIAYFGLPIYRAFTGTP